MLHAYYVISFVVQKCIDIWLRYCIFSLYEKSTLTYLSAVWVMKCYTLYCAFAHMQYTS